MNDVIVRCRSCYIGGEKCTGDKEILKKVRDKLVEAKPNWVPWNTARSRRSPAATSPPRVYWNGAALRSRLPIPAIRLRLSEGRLPLFMDSVAILKDAKNVENAKLFQNFIMDPENAAMISAFARYANGIKGSEAFMPADMKDAPGGRGSGGVRSRAASSSQTCPPEVQELYTKIWTELQK